MVKYRNSNSKLQLSLLPKTYCLITNNNTVCVYDQSNLGEPSLEKGFNLSLEFSRIGDFNATKISEIREVMTSSNIDYLENNNNIYRVNGSDSTNKEVPGYLLGRAYISFCNKQIL